MAETARKLALVTKQPRPVSEMTVTERRTYLRSTLPPGAFAMFTALSGNRGLYIVCPRCDARPPHHIRNWNRWRWLAVHEMTAHKGESY